MLNWAIIGSGDVVQRLVSDSLFVKNKSSVECVISDDFNQLVIMEKNIKLLAFIQN